MRVVCVLYHRSGRRTTLHGARRRSTPRGKPSCSRFFFAPLVVEQLADVLALVEKKEREEDARMDQLGNMILEGRSVSAADKEGWRRWARAVGQREKGRRGGKGSCRGRPCDQQLEFQQSQLVIVEAPQFACRDRCVQCTFAGAASGQDIDVPVVVRQGFGLDAHITLEVPRLQFLANVYVLVVVQRQVLFSKQCRTLFGSSQLQFLDKVIDVPVICNDTPWSRLWLVFSGHRFWRKSGRWCSLCVPPWSRLWLLSRATDYGGNREGDTAGAYRR